MGASNGPVPDGHTKVSRWIGGSEIKHWYKNGGTTIPRDVDSGGRVFVTKHGAPNLEVEQEQIEWIFTFLQALYKKVEKMDGSPFFNRANLHQFTTLKFY